MIEKRNLYIWGQFSPEDTLYLNDIQNLVRSKLKCEKFEPHITLTKPNLILDKNLLKLLDNLTKKNFSLELRLKSYNYSNEFFKSFYLDIFNSNKIYNLRNEIIKFNKSNLNDNFNPHISLSYGNHEKDLKDILIKSLLGPKNSIMMTKLSIVDVKANINQWEILDSFEFK